MTTTLTQRDHTSKLWESVRIIECDTGYYAESEADPSYVTEVHDTRVEALEAYNDGQWSSTSLWANMPDYLSCQQ